MLILSAASVSGYNNIVYGNTATNNPNYQGSANFTYSCSSPAFSGTGNISGNPDFTDPFTDDYSLTPGSPCIDTGNPNSPLDPDGTRADMGAVYFNQGEISAIEDLTISVNGINIMLNWSAIAGATVYHVYQSSDPYFEIGGMTPVSSSPSNQYLDQRVVPGSFYYIVTAE